MENIFFLILVAVVGLIRWFLQAAENKKNAEAAKRGGDAAPPEPSGTLIPRGASQTEEERVRKFFEALGVPTTTDPPPRVQPREVVPKQPPTRKILPVDPFPVPRGRALEPRPRTETPPPIIVAPPPLPATPPLPTRETTVMALPREPRPNFAHAAEFEVRDIDEGIAEDSFSHAGVRTDGGKAKTKTAEASIAARLGNAQGLRDAVVLREIFGPPRSMQPLDRQTVG